MPNLEMCRVLNGRQNAAAAIRSIGVRTGPAVQRAKDVGISQ
jgi:hypothetical protein